MRPKPRIAAVLSVVFHVVFFGLLMVTPRDLLDSNFKTLQEPPRPEDAEAGETNLGIG